MTSQLTARQKEILLFGSSSLAGRGFIADEEVSAWSEHRAELLLAAAGSLARPDAYFRYELCEVTPSWIEDVYQLYRRKLLPAPAETPSMDADQSWELHCEFETVESVRRLPLPTPLLEDMLREFGSIVAYMRYRQRPALIKKYLRIHACIRLVLRESLTVLIKAG